MTQNVRIISKLFTLPSGETRLVESHQAFTSRARAIFYVKIKSAKWDDPEKKGKQDAIYFLDPKAIQTRNQERREGKCIWYVGDSGGSSLVKAYTGQSGGTRVLMTSGSEHSFMDAK